ncbi:Cutinase gene palindrome-binding protein like [Verticillium longisporum]|nr:Cutinase gene palindrome-binding protein like [Verticillium longisporum]
MSRGPPPPAGANAYTFGDFDFNSLVTDAMADDPSMMAMLGDSSMYDNFDSMGMNLDNPPDDTSLAQFSVQMNNNQVAAAAAIGQAMRDGSPMSPQQKNGSNFFSLSAEDHQGSGPGAGPAPAAGFSSQANMPGGNTLTEFTKRRNWPAKVVEELKDFLQILDANGRIRFVSPSILSVTGYTSEEIADKFLKDFIHDDDVGVFVAELNESIASGNPLRMFYRFKKKDDTYAIFEAVGHAHIAAAKFAPNPHNQSPFCQAVFMMARPYPTKNAGLLDSFLEHKIENERLRRRIAELRREEEAENDESQRQWASQDGRSDATPSETTIKSSSVGRPALYHQNTSGSSTSMGPPPDRTPLNVALTREALEGVANSRPDSLKEKMARYEGSHAEQIEMLTGLNYVDGERSKGITTGNASPTLIKGDAGIAIPMDRDPRTGDKKKKLKTSEEYVCTDCGTLDSPEWRKGPSGPKTLCNACGLRWAKKEKKVKNSPRIGGGAMAE